MNCDRPDITTLHLPANSNACRSRKPLKAAMPANMARGEGTRKPAVMANTVVERKTSKQTALAMGTRRRKQSTATHSSTTTSTTTTTTTASTAMSKVPRSELSNNEHTVLSSTVTSTGNTATVAAAAAPPLLSKPLSKQSRISPSRFTTASSGITTATATVAKVLPDKRSRSVSVTKRRLSREPMDAKTRTAGVKLPPLAHDDETTGGPTSSEAPTAANAHSENASLTRTLTPLHDMAFNNQRYISKTPPSLSQPAGHHPPVGLSSNSTNTSTHSSVANSHANQLFGPLKRSGSLVPLSPASNNMPTLFSRTPPPQEPFTCTTSKPASMASDRTSPASRHASAMSFSISALQSNTSVNPSSSSPPTASTASLSQKQEHLTPTAATAAPPLATPLVSDLTSTKGVERKGSVKQEVAIAFSLDPLSPPLSKHLAPARFSPCDVKALESVTMRVTGKRSDDEAISKEAPVGNDDYADMGVGTGSGVEDTGVNGAESDEEEDGDEVTGKGDAFTASAEDTSAEEEEDEEVEDDSEVDTEDEEEDDEGDDEEDDDVGSEEEDSEETEDDDDGSESGADDDNDEDSEDDEERRKARRAATKRKGGPRGWQAASSPKAFVAVGSGATAAEAIRGKGEVTNSTAHCSKKTSKKKSKDSAVPVRIRTKISREGDLNVKVVYAVRTRHCFNRFVKEIMTRFGFAKATDFDMYCIDATGDRVDIDVEEDFDLLLDAFEATMAAGAAADSKGGAQQTDTPGRSLHSVTDNTSPDDYRRGMLAPSTTPGPLRASQLHSYNDTVIKGGSPVSSLYDHVNGAAASVGCNNGNRGNNNSSNMSMNTGGGNSQKQLQVLRSSSASSGFGATNSLIAGGSVLEDDGKSNASVLRLYVRYSNAYYVQHSGSPSAAASLYASPNPPCRLTDPNGTSFLANQLQQSSYLCPTSKAEGWHSADPMTGALNGGTISRRSNNMTTAVNNSDGSSFSHTLLASAAGSISASNGLLLLQGSPATINSGNGGTAHYGSGFTGAYGASIRASHLMNTGLEPLSPKNASASLAILTETQRSTLNGTFVVDENELVEWRRMSVLGKGSFGTVYEGITLDGKMIAVKVQELPVDDDGAEIKALQAEINLMRSLKHRNIVAYYGCQTRVTPAGGQQMEIFMELCHGGSLATLRRKLIKTQQTFGISLVRSYSRQVLEGLAYLHSQHVIHRDIKSDNVLISATGEAKLADFGCSKRFGGTTAQASSTTATGALSSNAGSSNNTAAAGPAPAAMYQTMVGSPFFMAPEVMREDEGGYTSAADIWSVGCLVIELLGREPWEVTGTNIFQIMFRIAREQGMPSGVPPNCPPMLLSFFERCFERDPAKRATAAELLGHEWITCPDKLLEEVATEPEAK